MNQILKNKILRNPYISDWEKSESIKDIEAQHILKYYGARTDYNMTSETLTDSFLWHKSLLGSHFWQLISSRIDTHETINSAY